MKVFISWSGPLSKKLGEAFRKWLPAVLQTVQPYFTPDDIEKGNRWASEIANELEGSAVGILCLTKENLEKPWIMFEAGALAKHLDKARVCPILFGVEPTDLTGPLVQFQATPFTKDEVKKLITTINNQNAEQRLDADVLDPVFEMWWPRLEEQVGKILAKATDASGASVRKDRDLLEEILELSRLAAHGATGPSRRGVDPFHWMALIEALGDTANVCYVSKSVDAPLAQIVVALEHLGGAVQRSTSGEEQVELANRIKNLQFDIGARIHNLRARRGHKEEEEQERKGKRPPPAVPKPE